MLTQAIHSNSARKPWRLLMMGSPSLATGQQAGNSGMQLFDTAVIGCYGSQRTTTGIRRMHVRPHGRQTRPRPLERGKGEAGLWTVEKPLL